MSLSEKTTNSINATNERTMAAFRSTSGARELANFLILDRSSAQWIANGHDHSWLELSINEEGLIQARAFQSVQDASGAWSTHPIDPAQYDCSEKFDEKNYDTFDNTLMLHIYGLHVALLAARSACERGDMAMVARVLGLALPHIPWLGGVRDMSTAMQGGDADAGLVVLSKALTNAHAWTIFDPGRSELSGPLHPWVQASIIMELMAYHHPLNTTCIYAFNDDYGNSRGYLWSSTSKENLWSSTSKENLHSIENLKMILLDVQLQPVLLLTRCPGHDTIAPRHCADWIWSLPQCTNALNTLARWGKILHHYPSTPSVFVRTLARTTPRKLHGQEEAQALELWLNTKNTAIEWSESSEVKDVLVLSRSLSHSWGQHNAQAAGVISAIAEPWKINEDPSQVERWLGLARQVIQPNTDVPETLALPDLDTSEPAMVK